MNLDPLTLHALLSLAALLAVILIAAALTGCATGELRGVMDLYNFGW